MKAGWKLMAKVKVNLSTKMIPRQVKQITDGWNLLKSKTKISAMRTILAFLFTLLFAGIALGQKPTREQMETQKAEALKDAKQQVTDLKKEIADAKARNEDAESIKQLEDQLRIVEKMVTVLDNTSLS